MEQNNKQKKKSTTLTNQLITRKTNLIIVPKLTRVSIEINHKLEIISADNSFYDLIGENEEDNHKNKLIDYIYKKDRAQFKKYFGEKDSAIPAQRLTFNLKLPNKQLLPIEWTVKTTKSKEKNKDSYELIGQYALSDIVLKSDRKKISRSVDNKHSKLNDIEAKYRFALTNTNDVFWEWDIQTDNINLSSKFYKAHDSNDNKSSINVNEWINSIHPDDLTSIKCEIEKIISGRSQVFEKEYRIKDENNKYIWILDKGQIISWSSDQKPLTMFCIRKNITDKKTSGEISRLYTRQMFRRQAVLLELAKSDKSNFDSSLRKILKADSETLNIERVSYWTFNEEKTELTCALLYLKSKGSYSAGFKLHYAQCPKYFKALSKDKIICATNVYNDGRTNQLSTVYLKQNKINSLMSIPLWIQDRMIGIVCHEVAETNKEWTFEDQEFGNSIAELITLSIVTSESKKAEKEIVKLSQAIDQSPVSVIITDTLGNVEYINPKFNSITGYNKEDVINQNWSVLKPNDFNTVDYSELVETVSSGEEWHGEILNKKRDGQLFWVSTSVSPIKNRQDEITNYLVIQEDITDRKFMDIELKRALDKAEESSKLKSSLLANMSHELRTPMNGVLGFAQLLSEEIVDPVQKQMLQKIQHSGKRLMRTLNTILDLTELESNEFLLSVTQLKIAPALPYLFKEFEDKAKEKGLYFNYEISNKNIAAFADETVFKKIMINLIDNAVKFTIKGGIKIQIDEEIKDDEEGSIVKIHVIDTGIGIAEKNKELIFNEFRQASEGISRSYEGSGLGLTLARKMARLINGDILVESQLGVGSKFTLVLPGMTDYEIKPEEDLTSNSSLQVSAIDYIPELLLVEDNIINKEVVEVFLNGICKVDHAIDGNEAVKMAKEKKYLTILMDINLGAGMNGIEALKEIRKIQGYENTPAIAITGYAMSGDKEKFMNEGMTHYLSKPFEKHILIKMITEIISQNQSN